MELTLLMGQSTGARFFYYFHATIIVLAIIITNYYYYYYEWRITAAGAMGLM